MSGFAPSWLNVTRPAESGYRYHERWAHYLAPPERCPGADATGGSTAVREGTMLCLLNYARERRGLPVLRTAPRLMAAARLKAHAIVRCDDFSHEACGSPVEATARRTGYIRAGRVFGENIAWGTMQARSPRATVDGWLASPGHRRNLFTPEWRDQGVAVVEAEGFQGVYGSTAIWVSHFGRRR